MNMLRLLGIFALSLMLATPEGFAQHRPGPRPGPRPSPGPRPGPRPHPGPRPAPMPRPVPRPMPRPVPRPMPRPVPRPMPRPVPRPMPRPIPRPIPRPVPRPMPIPRPLPSPLTACFYQYANFTGNYVCVNPGQGIVNLAAVGMDNKISSAVIPAGYSVSAYKSSGYRGDVTVLMGSIHDLSAYGFGWDNAISSLHFNQ